MTEGFFTPGTIPRLPDHAKGYPRWRFSVLASNCTSSADMRALVDEALDKGFGKVCIISDNSYRTIPDYWEEEVAYIASKKPKPTA